MFVFFYIFGLHFVAQMEFFGLHILVVRSKDRTCVEIASKKRPPNLTLIALLKLEVF